MTRGRMGRGVWLLGGLMALVSCCALAGGPPPDKPVSVEDARAMRALETAMAPYVAQARRTWPDARAKFLAGLPADQRFYVTARLHDDRGTTEQVFVAVRSVRDGRIEGRIASEILSVRGYRVGDAIEIDEAALIDWTISHADGIEEGNVVGKFLDTWSPPTR